MAAGEDQTEAIVFDLFISVSSFPPGASLTRDSMWATRSLCAPSKRARRRITSMALKRAVEISHGTWIVRNASLRPGLQSGGECLMHRLFGQIQVSEEAHQRRQNPARFRPVKSLNGPAELFGHRRRHLRQASKRSGFDTTALASFVQSCTETCRVRLRYKVWHTGLEASSSQQTSLRGVSESGPGPLRARATMQAI